MASKISNMPVTEEMIPAQEPFDQTRGWRYKLVALPDGREVSYMIPLTSEDFLNPQEGDVWPQTPLHARLTDDLTFMLRSRYANTNIVVFHDFIINWGIPGLANPSPDISVIADLADVKRLNDEGAFFVKQVGVKPVFIIEVVSPWYRQEDLVDKVGIYEQAGVAEYVIFDFFSPQSKESGEVLMYRLVNGRYQQQTADENGLFYCQTVDLRLGLEYGEHLVLEDGATGERLRTPDEEIAARGAAEARVAELEAEVRRLRGEG